MFEIAPAPGGRRVASVVGGGVVVIQLPLPLLGDHPQEAQVQVGHDRPASWPRIGIETATA
jgi:hypothetical protein